MVKPLQVARKMLPRRAWQWCRRNPMATALVVTLVALSISLSFNVVAHYRMNAELTTYSSRLASDLQTHKAELDKHNKKWKELLTKFDGGALLVGRS